MTPSPQTKSKRKPAWLAKTELERGLAGGRCPVCWSLRRSARRYIFSFLYEGMMSGSARETFLKGGGFCREHFWQAKAIEAECWADGFGIAILCENLLDRSLNDVKQIPDSKPEKKPSLLRIPTRPARRPAVLGLIPRSGCTVCAVLRESENHYLAVLEELLEDTDFSQRYQSSAGLCFYHLQVAAGQWQSSVALRLVKSTADGVVRQLIAELREFQRKHDYQYTSEPRGPEWTSPERAIEFLVGPMAELAGFADLMPTRKQDR